MNHSTRKDENKHGNWANTSADTCTEHPVSFIHRRQNGHGKPRNGSPTNFVSLITETQKPSEKILFASRTIIERTDRLRIVTLNSTAHLVNGIPLLKSGGAS